MASWNPLTWFQTQAPIIEADVLTFIQKVETDVKVAITDCENAATWVAQQTPTIAADLQTALSFVSAVPVVAANPTVAAAITAANIAVAGLTAFAKTYNQVVPAGTTPNLSAATQSVVAGYQAVKAAQAAAATVAATAVAATNAASK